MDKSPIKVILKNEPGKDGAVILFLPDSPVNPGRIGYYSPTEGHGEADLAYYYRCTPYRDGIVTDAEKILSSYARQGGEYYPVKRVYRQTANDYAAATRRLDIIKR